MKYIFAMYALVFIQWVEPHYTCTKLMNNFNKVMKMKRKQCANLKKQSRNEQEQVRKKKTITITKMQTKNETLTQK